MSRAEWAAHADRDGLWSMEPAARKAHSEACPICKARRSTKRATLRARTRSSVLSSLGMKRTAGGWE